MCWGRIIGDATQANEKQTRVVRQASTELPFATTAACPQKERPHKSWDRESRERQKGKQIHMKVADSTKREEDT